MIFRKNKRPLIPSRNPKVDGISPSASRARQILQIHRETRKQPHECSERNNVAVRSGLYKLISWAPKETLHSRHQNGKDLLYRNFHRKLNMAPRAFAFGRSRLRQTPNIILCGACGTTAAATGRIGSSGPDAQLADVYWGCMCHRRKYSLQEQCDVCNIMKY